MRNLTRPRHTTWLWTRWPSARLAIAMLIALLLCACDQAPSQQTKAPAAPAAAAPAADPPAITAAHDDQPVQQPGLAPTPYLAAAGRSPMPEPGEQITHPIKYERLAEPEERPAPKPGEFIPWHQAKHHLGHTITVEGEIKNASRFRDKLCFLNYTTKWHGRFYCVIFKDAYADLPELPEKYFLNKTLRVTGKVQLHKDRPQIQIHSMDQVEIVEQATPAGE